MEILRILWSKALLLVLQNLRPTHIGTLKLSPFELTARHPSSSHLFHSQLIKGDILQGCKGLITLTENNHASVEQFFSKTSNTTLCNLEISLLRKTSPKKPLYSTMLEKPLSSVTDQSLCHQAPGSMCVI